MPLTIEPLHPTFGAEISGVDISKPLDDATRRALVDAIDRHGVCVYRDTGLDDDTHVDFSRIFGYVELGPARAVATDKGTMQRRELFAAGNLDAAGNIVTDEEAIAHKLGDRLWHTDCSFMPIRASYSLLLAHVVPPRGGETWFADTRTAYGDLPAEVQQRIAGLEVVHSLWWSRYLGGFPIDEPEIDRRPSAVQPLVLHHEPSGRDALYVAAHARDVVGLGREEGRALLAELLEHASRPQYTFAVEWNPGDLVIWDNRTTMHRGGPFDERRERRDLRRTTIRDGAAPLTDDDPYGAMFSASAPAPSP